MVKNFIIPLVIYPYDVMFSVGETDKQFKKSVKKRLRKEFYADLVDDEICSFTESHRGRTWHNLIGGQTIIRLPKHPNNCEEFGTLSHEIFHAVVYIMERIGMKLSGSSDEAYAYLIGYITEQFWLNVCDK